MAMAYLDNSATTQVSALVAQAAVELMCNTFGNPASIHSLGLDAHKVTQSARETLASYLGCKKEEIYFTSGGTEGNNLAILGGAMAAKRKGNKIITTAVEHPSVLQAMEELKNRGFETVVLPVQKNGVVSLQDLEDAIDEQTILISVMLVNNETGAIQPVDKIRETVKRKKSPALIHTDCVQALGKYPFSLRKLDVDLASVSGHKVHAPKGVGALYIKEGVRILPQTYGGGQEKGLRSGTVAVSQIGAFAKAVEELPKGNEGVEQATRLRERLLAGIATVGDAVINSTLEGSPYIVNCSVAGIPSEVMIRALEAEGVYVSGGSACAKGGRSHVLLAQGVAPKLVDSALRISFSNHTTMEEIQQFLTAFTNACRVLHRKR